MADARAELNFKNNFELLISVILSAQTTDKAVNSVTHELFSSYPTPETVLRCGEAQLRKIIQPIGLAPTKAKNIIKTCQILMEKYNGDVPCSREKLQEMPGVGRKTAYVVLNEGFGVPTIAVDTHVYRVSNRTGLAPGKTRKETEYRLINITPNKWKKKAHHYLILHGRYVCKAKNFTCTNCIIEKECEFNDKMFK